VAKAADKSTSSDPSKIKLSDLVRVEDMFARMRPRVAHRQSAEKTKNDLETRFRSDWRTWERQVDSNGEEIPGTLKPVSDDWKTTPRLLIDGTDEAPYLRVLDRRPPIAGQCTEFFGLARDIEGWESRQPMLVTPPSAPSKEPAPISLPVPGKELSNTPRQKPGPPTVHNWFAIWSEILRRCINPQTGLIALPKSRGKPKSELSIAEDVAVWYEDKYKRSVGVTDVRAAVKDICAVLKDILDEIQSRSKASKR
jgi:hypothetical protein